MGFLQLLLEGTAVAVLRAARLEMATLENSKCLGAVYNAGLQYLDDVYKAAIDDSLHNKNYHLRAKGVENFEAPPCIPKQNALVLSGDLCLSHMGQGIRNYSEKSLCLQPKYWHCQYHTALILGPRSSGVVKLYQP